MVRLSSLWELILGSFDAFRARWHDDSVARNGKARHHGFVPQLFPPLVHETFLLHHWKWSNISVVVASNENKHVSNVLTHVSFGLPAGAACDKALSAVKPQITQRLKECRRWCLTNMLNQLISISFEFSHTTHSRLSEVINALREKDAGVL